MPHELTDEEFHAQKCSEKTEKGNVFPNFLQADARAAYMSAKKRKNIQVYQCPYCHLYHVGSATKRTLKHPVRRGKRKGAIRT